MRIKILLVVCFTTLSFNFLYGQAPAAEALKAISWLQGEWERTNARPGRQASEKWQTISGTEMTGIGLVMQGVDTLYVEDLRIIVDADELYYVAKVPENDAPVRFRITHWSPDSFTCENSEHDFPKKISYHLDGNALKATISGGGKSFDYHFTRK